MEQLSKRLEEVEDQLQSAELHLRDLVTRRAGWDLGDFISSAADLYFIGGIQTAEELADQISDGADITERLQFAEIFLQWLKDHEVEIRSAHDDGARSVDALRARGVDIEPMFESVAEELLRQLRPKSTSPFEFDVSDIAIPSFSVDEAGRTVSLQRWDALLRDIEIANRSVKDLGRERLRVLARLKSLSPQGVKGTMVALGSVVLAGIAFPVIVMAMRMPELTAPWRWTMVGVFLASVGVVGLYISYFSRTLETTGSGGSATDANGDMLRTERR